MRTFARQSRSAVACRGAAWKAASPS